ncbi:hypothetical protein LOD99_7142 [Oopsacas minuta]|uniref:Uncharacterized protein n=1 Tax=Oopsacas minuta TaxID=111878 RepID=A0AAV7JK55_9METZ|nr:hypothetical protein LOD99_7142 [Oopsacas minuta]
MFLEVKEQLLFEEFIRGLPRQIYENIWLSSDITTSENSIKRAQILIPLQNESSRRTEGKSIEVSKRNSSKRHLIIHKIDRKLMNEAVKQITEQLRTLACNEIGNSMCC